MRTNTRKLYGYHEDSGPFNVDGGRARYVVEAATDIIGRYTRQLLTVESVAGVQLELGDEQQLNPRDLWLGGAKHELLITRRQIDAACIGIKPGVIVRGTYVPKLTQAGLSTKIVIADYDPGADKQAYAAINNTVHEQAHSFGLAHCAVSECVMFASINSEHAQAGNTPITTDNPFCTNCVYNLDQGTKMEGILDMAIAAVQHRNNS
ncbi:MAG TPA: hypothetical protein VLG47_06510 [Candidatus Saccharimonadales bacterium]|nr:hypothetical protein [Candidatus Saccharimonadales bacterium]